MKKRAISKEQWIFLAIVVLILVGAVGLFYLDEGNKLDLKQSPMRQGKTNNILRNIIDSRLHTEPVVVKPIDGIIKVCPNCDDDNPCVDGLKIKYKCVEGVCVNLGYEPCCDEGKECGDMGKSCSPDHATCRNSYVKSKCSNGECKETTEIVRCEGVVCDPYIFCLECHKAHGVCRGNICDDQVILEGDFMCKVGDKCMSDQAGGFEGTCQMVKNDPWYNPNLKNLVCVRDKK